MENFPWNKTLPGGISKESHPLWKTYRGAILSPDMARPWNNCYGVTLSNEQILRSDFGHGAAISMGEVSRINFLWLYVSVSMVLELL